MAATIIAFGRVTTLLAAVITVFGAVVAGWVWGVARDVQHYGQAYTKGITPNEVVCALLGLFAGLVIAGVVFGLAVAVYDMQQSLRIIAQRGSEHNARRGEHRGLARAEPRLGGL